MRIAQFPAAADAQAVMVGASAAMQEARRLIERAGPTDCCVLLIGEPGCGKELAARVLHASSARRARPFLAVDCGAHPAEFTEAELFGRESGAAGPGGTAWAARAGAFERAHGGTLLLDDVADLPEGLQARLLRTLETGRLRRIGGADEHAVDVRLIATMRRSPDEELRRGRVREDLLYRLAVFPVEIPALRERGGDVALLAAHFLAELNAREGTRKRFSGRSCAVLDTHAWPGNVRELKACVERAFLRADYTLELAASMPPAPPAPDTPDAPAEAGERLQIRVGSRIHDVERSLIEATLEHFRGDKRRAANALGCSLKTLYNKLNGYLRRPAPGPYSRNRDYVESIDRR